MPAVVGIAAVMAAIAQWRSELSAIRGQRDRERTLKRRSMRDRVAA